MPQTEAGSLFTRESESTLLEDVNAETCAGRLEGCKKIKPHVARKPAIEIALRAYAADLASGETEESPNEQNGLGLGRRRTAGPSTSLRYGRDDNFFLTGLESKRSPRSFHP